MLPITLRLKIKNSFLSRLYYFGHFFYGWSNNLKIINLIKIKLMICDFSRLLSIRKYPYVLLKHTNSTSLTDRTPWLANDRWLQKLHAILPKFYIILSG